VILLLASIIVSSVVSVADVPNPRAANRWVTDQANVLDASAEAKIDATAEALNKARGIELAIVTVDDTAESPKAFATALFNRWGIGSAQTNNGVLVLLVMGKRRLEIETGTGIEAALPPDWLSAMQGREMVPKFKSGDFGGGLVAGVEAIAAHLRDAPGESTSTAGPGEYRSDGRVVDPDSPAANRDAPSTTTTTTGPQPSYTPPEEVSPILPFALGGLGALGITGGVVLVRRRRRTCQTCEPSRAMINLDEAADDAHLDDGQRAEERLGSVDYDVYICPGCQASRTFRRGKWFSGFDKCGKCSYKTSKSTSTTIASATYDHGGQVRVDEHCKHCGHSSSRIRHTAARTRPSTTSSSSSSRSYSSSSSRSSYSSSSSRSSYSGGSSRGGGSGSSW
jgi:uncharacterized protein